VTAGRAASPILELDGLVASRRHGRSCFQISVDRLTISAGEPIFVQGRSGSGKSTLMDVLGLVLRPDRAGRFTLRDDDGSHVDVGSLQKGRRDEKLTMLRRHRIGYMPQTGALLSYLTVRDNILLPARLSGRETPGRLDYLARALDIARLLPMMPHQLSMGERQRVSLARALVHQPPLILADEPTASLDPVNGRAVLDLLLRFAPAQGSTPVVASHDDAFLGSGAGRLVRVEVDEKDSRAGAVVSRVVSA
jgi:putative ABC transport system ATP-binding protein